ncbi:MAG: GTPase Era [Synergistetes bacterium ADurb.Bin520]|nr:MAG: GTPase Era [Synergistetes bacterium ADurb.Bin520]
MKSASVAVVGRPGAGKSTLINRITGHKVSITAPVPQTTRNRIRGILTEERGQIIFIDTPGYHLSDRKFNLRLRDLVTGTLKEADLAVYVMDSTRPVGEEEEAMAEKLLHLPCPVVAALNKSDLASETRKPNRLFIGRKLPAAEIVEVSALTGTGFSPLLDRIFALAPEGDPLYPPDYYTDQDPEFRAAEIIREKAIAATREEVPHALYVEIADMEAAEEKDKSRLWIRAFLVVERESQQGILVGKGGERIRDIRTEAQKELGRIFPYRIHLDLRVKTRPRWRRDEALLRGLIR